MPYETAAQMAERLNVTIRMVQVWAKEGKLQGAIKQGRDWLIPAGLGKPGRNAVYTQQVKRIPLPLISNHFKPGTCLEHIETMDDEVLKNLARAEYYYFSGQAEAAANAAQPYLDNEDITVRLSSCFVFAFANIALGNTELSRNAFGRIKDCVNEGLDEISPIQLKSLCTFIETTASVLLHTQPPEQKLADYIKYLPLGLKIWACYIMAYDAYLQEDYNKSLGIVETILFLASNIYPVQMTHLYLLAAMNLMVLKRTDEAKQQFYNAWKLAHPDGFIEAFAENHSLLCGLVEVCLKDKFPTEYEKIISITYNFSDGWRKIYNSDNNSELTSSLTTTEFAIAMLANRGWSNQEIADFMKMSPHTIKRYISITYQKLGITSRSGLKRFMHP